MTAYRHSLTRRWALWAFALALLLKAAMPMLASASAQAQGKAVVEVCTVYGVSLVSLDGDAPGAAGAPGQPVDNDHLTAHSGEHCALNALPMLAALDAPPAIVPPAARLPQPVPLVTSDDSPYDASARWVAGLHHGPPESRLSPRRGSDARAELRADQFM